MDTRQQRRPPRRRLRATAHQLRTLEATLDDAGTKPLEATPGGGPAVGTTWKAMMARRNMIGALKPDDNMHLQL